MAEAKCGNRERILKEALKLFYKKGYESVSVQEIADASGITKPTLYYYFKSKRGLLDVLLEETILPYNEALHVTKGTYETRTIFEETLVQVVQDYIKAAATSKESYFLMLTLFYAAEDSESHMAVLPYLRDHLNLLCNMLEGAREYLNLNGRSVEQIASGFSGFLNMLILVHYSKKKSLDGLANEETAHSIVYQFLNGVYA
ncbi:MAG: TetR/AcrR family transcriptional regulator [Clostridiales bacterium]|nr:TetR/AcrR family transcriptional regulator [Clostridiales bacterium]